MRTTLIPHISCRDASRAIAFYESAFDANTLGVMNAPDGRVLHAALEFGGSTLYISDEFPEHGGTSPQALGGTATTLHLQVPDCDAVFDHAVKAGCEVVMPLDDMFWGDRYGTLQDPFGHRWSVATHQREVSPEEAERAFAGFSADALDLFPSSRTKTMTQNTQTRNTIDPATRCPVEGAKNRTEGHLWLQRLVGEWTYEAQATMPDGSSETMRGTESTRKLGEYWVVGEAVGPMPDDGTEGRTIQSLGYDIAKRAFVGSFIGSMMEILWVGEGHLDEEGTLNLDAEGPNYAEDGGRGTMRDAIRFEDNDHQVRTSLWKDEGGEWVPFMTSRYTRVGS